MQSPRRIELLAPAKTSEIGIEAIRHGADAVYIGAPRFGARQAAGNSLTDICQLVQFAHLYGARVYVALNTILKDDELDDAQALIKQLYAMRVDALIIQDMGILEMDLPPIALHASTQTDNRCVEKVTTLEQLGFSQVVLARELSLSEIQNISRQTHVALEVFIHGALCVSYSGQCYLSAALSGRSANRGECAQYCRLPYTLKEGSGKVVYTDKHLLSLKDLNQSDRLEQLLDAGVTSLKIEGRLKEMSYVKNCVAYYRQRLDEIFSQRPNDYTAASFGKVKHLFQPNLQKSFNRGFSHYFLDAKASQSLISADTPKSIGEPIGQVKEISRSYFTVAGCTPMHNGDGLCFKNEKGEFEGFRANRVEDNRVFPITLPPTLKPKTPLYRNLDLEFEKLLSRPSAERRLSVDLTLSETEEGFTLRAIDEAKTEASIEINYPKERGRISQQENIIKQLSKWGETIFQPKSVDIRLNDNWFIPSSTLSSMRQQLAEKLIEKKQSSYSPDLRLAEQTDIHWHKSQLSYTGNVANRLARLFYTHCKVSSIDPAFELSPQENVPLMFTRYCLRRELGCCLKTAGGKNLKAPLTLHYRDQELSLEFDCLKCEMKIYKK